MLNILGEKDSPKNIYPYLKGVKLMEQFGGFV